MNNQLSIEFMREFKEAYCFIENHPAFYNSRQDVAFHFWTSVQSVCKHGYALEDSPKTIKIWGSHERYQEFRDKAKEEDIEDFEEDTSLSSVDVDYEDFFGCAWKEDRIEIWLESGPYRYFQEDIEKGVIYNPQGWADHELDMGGPSYEAVIIELAKKVKEKYGNFSSSPFENNSIIPEWITEFNKDKHPFDIDLLRDEGWQAMSDRSDKLIAERKYIRVRSEEENEIWWQLWAKEHLPTFFKDYMEWGGVKYHPIDVEHLVDYEKFKTYVSV
jgi:hypothetical protein